MQPETITGTNNLLMKEKIFLKLKAQRGTTSNLSDRSLDDLARSLESIITTDEILSKFDFSAAIASLDGNINHYTAEQVKKIKEAEEKRLKEEAEKKAAEEAAKNKDPKEETPEWAKAIIEANKVMAERIASFEKEKTILTKKEQARLALQNSKLLPKEVQDKWKDRINIESELPIEQQIQELEKEYTEIHTTIVGKNSGKGLPLGNQTPDDEVPQHLKDFFDKKEDKDGQAF